MNEDRIFDLALQGFKSLHFDENLRNGKGSVPPANMFLLLNSASLQAAAV